MRLLLAAMALVAVATTACAQAIVPDPTLTLGSIRTVDVAAICSSGTRQLRHWSRERDDHIMTEYGLPRGPHPDFEVDHLIPLGAGGAGDDRNLWAEPRRVRLHLLDLGGDIAGNGDQQTVLDDRRSVCRGRARPHSRAHRRGES